jgi:hypothetical protein
MMLAPKLLGELLKSMTSSYIFITYAPFLLLSIYWNPRTVNAQAFRMKQFGVAPLVLRKPPVT